MTVAKVAGGTVAVGGTTGVAGYGTYRYLTYETLRNLIEKEKNENLVLLKEEDSNDIWNKAADNYLVSLTESGVSSFNNKIDDKIKAISAEDTDLSSKRADFKKWCLKFLDSEVTEESKNNKDKVKAWCIKFESFGDKLEKEESKKLDLDNSNWTTQYDTLTSESQNNALKTLLEAKKKSFTSGEDSTKKTEAAKWWCQLLINKKSDSSSSSDFQNKCLLKTGD